MSVHYHNARCIFLFLSPVPWETNVAKFSVAFIHKLLYNAGKNSVKMKGKKQIGNKRKTPKLNDKIQKTFVAVFAEYELIERLDKT